MIRILASATLILAAICWPGSSANAQSSNKGDGETRPGILVFAAASMKNVLEDIAGDFERQCSCKVTFSFAGSGTLARQIDAGAPADIFISADLRWMEWLAQKNAIEPESQRIIAGNNLVVAISARAKNEMVNKAADDRANGAKSELEQILENGRIAMADPNSVPAGRYGKQALEHHGLWHAVSNRLVFGENVRVSLLLAGRGNVAAAIVYRSDALIEPRVKIAYWFNRGDHEKITYPASLVRGSKNGEKFLNFLDSMPAKLLFKEIWFYG